MLDQQIDVSLVPATRHARPGGQLPFTLINQGSTPLLYGVDYALERWIGSEWVKCNVEEAFILIGYELDPGDKDDHYAAAIPNDALPGRYRITKEVASGTTVRERLSFEFEVEVEVVDRSDV